MAFYKDIGYVCNIVPSDASSSKRLKRFIKTRWLVDARIEGEIKVIFGK